MIKPCKDMTIEDWKEIILFLNPNMELLNKVPPKYNENIVCHCKKCNGTLYKNPQKVKDNVYRKIKAKTNTSWCPICNGKEVGVGINDLSTLRPDLVKYFSNPEDAKKVTLNSNKRINLKCPDCGTVKSLKAQDLVNYGFHCKVCNVSDSYPNRFCRTLLSMLPVEEYDTEYHGEWSKGKKYDGYFKFLDTKYLLEFDGNQHFKDTTWDTLQNQMQNDEIKNKLAIDNGFVLIRIDCRKSEFEYIKGQIYKSKLSNLFDLDSINWEIVNEKVSVGAFREIVDYYNNHQRMSNREIANQLHYHIWTVNYYLKEAQNLGMIDYCPFVQTIDHDLMHEICDFFVNNQNYSNIRLAKRFNVSTARIYHYLRQGINDNIIDFSQLTKEAFKYNRFADLKKEIS